VQGDVCAGGGKFIYIFTIMKSRNFIKKRFEEKDVIDILISQCEKGANYVDVGEFGFVLYPQISDEYYLYKGVHIAKCIPIKELGLDRLGQPGDIDILIIPFSENETFYERTAAIEIKVVRPTLIDMSKDANSQGTKQVKGLVMDGFPVVGLMHVCTPEPLPNELKLKTKFYSQKDKFDLNEYLNTTEFHEWDTFPGDACDNQMRRLITSDLPKYVGLNTIGINVDQEDNLIFTTSTIYDNFKDAYFNPNVKDTMIKSIESHFVSNPNSYLTISNL
jgi:hypothetical protein